MFKLKNNLFKLISIIVIIGVVCFLFVGCDNASKELDKQTLSQQTEQNDDQALPAEGMKQTNTVVSVEVEEVQSGSLANYVTVTGEARPYREVGVVPRLQEGVEKINVQVGDSVKKGDILLELKKEDELIAVEKAEAALKIAQANLQNTLNGSREEELHQLRAKLDAAKSDLELTQTNYDRYKELYDKEYISKQFFEEASNELTAAKSSYESARQSLKLAEAGSTSEEIKSLEGQVEQAQASLKADKLDLARATISAPISGIISDLDIEVGEISASSAVITIADLSRVKIETYISEAAVNKIKVGEDVDVDFEALEDKFTGEITSISPVADSTKKRFPVEIVVNNPNTIIKAGMYATIKLKTDRVYDQIIIPQNAVMEENGAEYVFIVKDNQAKRVEVTTGLSSEDGVAILNGLQAGEQLVITGQEYLKDGLEVKVVNRGDK